MASLLAGSSPGALRPARSENGDGGEASPARHRRASWGDVQFKGSGRYLSGDEPAALRYLTL